MKYKYIEAGGVECIICWLVSNEVFGGSIYYFGFTFAINSVIDNHTTGLNRCVYVCVCGWLHICYDAKRNVPFTLENAHVWSVMMYVWVWAYWTACVHMFDETICFQANQVKWYLGFVRQAMVAKMLLLL